MRTGSLLYRAALTAALRTAEAVRSGYDEEPNTPALSYETIDALARNGLPDTLDHR